MSWIDEYNARPDIGNVYQYMPRPAAPQQSAPRQSGNFFTHLLPTIGGIVGGAGGGALGGAAAGTAVLPGVGTAVGGLLGALLGGATGGAAGKVAENKVEGRSLGSDVARQALEQGILTAGPLRLLKGATAATKAIRGGNDIISALKAGGDAATAPSIIRSLIANKGAQAEARAGGFGIGEKVSGAQPLGFYDSANITRVLRDNGIKPGSPEARLKQVEDAMAQRGQQIDTHLATNNAALGNAAKNDIVANFQAALESQPGVDDLTRKKALDLAKNFMKQATDTQSVVNFRRGLDKQVINFNQNPSAALAAKQLAARTFRDVLSTATEKLAPGLAKANRSYSDLAKAKEYLIGGAKAISDQSQGGGGVFGFVRSNDVAQALKSKGGAVLQKAAPGEVSPYTVKGVASRLAPVGLEQALKSQANTSTSSAQMPTSASMNSMIPMDTLSQIPTENASTSPFDPANIEANIAKLASSGATIKDIGDYVALASAINSLQKASEPTTTIKPTGQQYGLAQGGLNSLQQLADLIQQDPSIVAKNNTPGQGLPLVGSYITNAVGAGDYHALADNVLQSLIHLQTGATATPEEVKAARGQLPQPGDSAEERQRKLNNLMAMFAPYVQGGQVGGSGVSANDLISALGGAYQ